MNPETKQKATRPRRLQEAGLLLVIFVLGTLLSIFGGSNEVQRNIISKAVLGL